MSPGEKLFLPIYLFIMAVGWLRTFLCMIPVMALSLTAGHWNALALLPRWGRWVPLAEGPGYRRFYRAFGWRRTLAALALDAAALGICVLLGSWTGWWILYAQRGRNVGRLLAAGCFVLGHCFPAGAYKNKEG